MKRILSAILAAAVIITVFSACGTESTKKKDEKTQSQSTASQNNKEEDSGNHTVYFKDSAKNSKVTATFLNISSGKSEDVEMKKFSEDKDSFTFSCEGDCSAYNMVYFTCGGKSTNKVAFNKCVSGWYNTKDDFMPYTEGEEINYYPEYDDVTLTGYGYEKSIHIWKPEGYDDSSDEKYSTVYVLDGQGFVVVGEDHDRLNGCVLATEQVKAMMSVTEKKAIVVAVENIFARDYELVPDIGESRDEQMFGGDLAGQFDSMGGTEFADFVANTLVPYVQKHYNVSTDALNTAIAGGSLGGLEAFYITMEYPDKFGTVGAMSPSFWEFEDATWKKYLREKKFDSDSPFLYFYTGSERGYADLDAGQEVKNMYNRLKKMGYPEDNLALNYIDGVAHDSIYWRNVFSEFLTAMMYRSIKPLQNN